MKYHDGHVHFFPPPLKNAIDRWFATAGWNIYYRRQQANELLQGLREGGADQISVLVYAHKPGMAESLNAWLYDFGNLHQGLHLFGTVHPDDKNLDVLVQHFLDDWNFDGFKIHANVQQVSVDDPRLAPVMNGVVERKRGLVIHAGREPHVNAFVGWRPFARLMARYPELKVQVAHLGFDEMNEFVAMSRDYPYLYFDTAAIGSPRFAVPTQRLQKIFETIPDRIIYGSDVPILEESAADHRNRLLHMITDPELRDNIFLKNAEQFWTR